MEVSGGRSKGAVSQHIFDNKDIVAGLKHISSKTVPQGMAAAKPSNPGLFFGLIIEFLRGSDRHRPVFIPVGEEPDREAAETSVGPEFPDQAWG